MNSADAIEPQFAPYRVRRRQANLKFLTNANPVRIYSRDDRQIAQLNSRASLVEFGNRCGKPFSFTPCQERGLRQIDDGPFDGTFAGVSNTHYRWESLKRSRAYFAHAPAIDHVQSGLEDLAIGKAAHRRRCVGVRSP